MKKPAKKNLDIFLLSLGCPRNLIDSEIIVGTLKKKGYNVIYEQKDNCIAIVNTCGFIEDAKSESIDAILELVSLKKKGKIKRIIVTGCLSQRYSKKLMDEVKEIDAIFGSSTFIEIPDYIDQILKNKKLVKVDKEPNFLYHHDMPRSLMTPKHSVYVKIQEGCMNFCSYCAIPLIRGKFRSRDEDSVLKEIKSLKERGTKEINIVGLDTTLYGFDKYKKSTLSDLLKKTSEIMEGSWIRLLYTHPAHYTEELISVLKNEPSICKYVDLPIQHINSGILKKMNRHVKKEEIVDLIGRLRENIPGIAIRTSVIVGFPGEGDKEFGELLDFIKETKFERMGAFVYSREEGTKAYDFPKQIPEEEKKKRLEKVMQLQQYISHENNKKCLGRTMRVLIDEKDLSSGQYIGRSEHDAPEVDGVVYVKSKKDLNIGNFVDVKIEDVLEYDLVGSV